MKPWGMCPHHENTIFKFIPIISVTSKPPSKNNNKKLMLLSIEGMFYNFINTIIGRGLNGKMSCMWSEAY